MGPGGGWEVVGGAVWIDRHAVHGAHFAGLAASTDLIKISQNYSISYLMLISIRVENIPANVFRLKLLP